MILRVIALLMACLMFSSLAYRSFAGESITGAEHEVERLVLDRGVVISFTNEIVDPVAGDVTGRVYRLAETLDARILLERQGMIVDQVLHRDFSGDGRNDLGVVWRRLGQARYLSFQVHAVVDDGELRLLFPRSEENVGRAEDLPYGQLFLPGEIERGPDTATFLLRHAICHVSRQQPLLWMTRWFGPGGDGDLQPLFEYIEEATETHQELNLAVEYYERGDIERGLALSLRVLQHIRGSGPEYLLSDAYHTIAHGYRSQGREAMAKAFERRAALRDATFMEQAIPEEER